MCGIAGFFQYDPLSPAPQKRLHLAAESLNHRGPDGLRFWENSDHSIAFAHARLSVIDLENGWQPMRDPESQSVLCYNGELYNYRELRTQLKAGGIEFKTTSDSEVVLKALVYWGVEALTKFNGMFALALYDPKDRSLLLARDPMGMKPLYYTKETKGLFFASELRTLATLSETEPQLDPAGLSHYLQMGYTLAPHTILKDIFQLPQGEWAVLKGKIWTTGKFSSLSEIANAKAGRKKTSKDCEEELQILLAQATERHLLSDVPVGIALSGGIDSSLLTATAIQTQKKSIPTFTVDFSQKGYSELSQAKAVASGLQSPHTAFTFNEASFFSSWQDWVWASDAPIFDSSFIATYFLYQNMRKQVTVGLSGDGGDELFLGYETYRADTLAAFLRKLGPLSSELAKLVLPLIRPKLGKVTTQYKLRAFLRDFDQAAGTAHCGWRSLGSRELYRSLFAPAKALELEALGPSSIFESLLAQVQEADPLTAMSYVDCHTWLSNDILVKADRASMAHGLEVRVPFLDKEVVAFALGLPDSIKFSLRQPKRILRQSLFHVLPSYPRTAKKLGFPTPISEWLLGPLNSAFEPVLKCDSLGEWINQESLQRIQREHREGIEDHGLLMWALSILASWLERVVKQRSVVMR